MAVDRLIQKGVVDSLQNNDLAGAINKAAHTWASIPLGPGSLDHSNMTYSTTSGTHQIGDRQPSVPYDVTVQRYQAFLDNPSRI